MGLDLKDADATLKEVRARFAEKDAENDRILADCEVKDGILNVPEAAAEAFRANLAAMQEMKGTIATIEEAKGLRDWSSTPANDAAALRALGIPAELQRRTLGQAFLESDEFKAMRESRGLTMAAPFEVKMADMGRLWMPPAELKDVYSDLPTGTPGAFGTIQRDPVVMRQKRTSRVRDLFPVQTTTAAVIEYIRVTGFTNAASVVPERTSNAFTAKPQSSLTFVGAQAPVRTIAHWEAAHRSALDDEPVLRGLIENELLYGLRLVEDDQILNGTGTGQDLQGILTDTGIQTYTRPGSPPANEQKADDIRRAATKALLSYYEPTGVVVHPTDWEKIELLKDTTGNYLLAVSIALGGEPRVWRMPVVQTPAIAVGTALVGAFGLGAQLYDREQGNIRIAEQHSDFFVRNAVAVLAEERLALAVKRPEAFVKVTLGA